MISPHNFILGNLQVFNLGIVALNLHVEAQSQTLLPGGPVLTRRAWRSGRNELTITECPGYGFLHYLLILDRCATPIKRCGIASG
jgi:hypothetical protein